MPNTVNTRSSEQDPGKGPVDKAMEVLEVLVQGGAPHRLAEIARRTGLSKPTVHRHLRAMAQHGFAEPAEGGSYRAGPRLLGLAAAALDAGPDLRLVRPVLADLRSRTGQVAHYAARHGTEAVQLEQSEAAGGYRMSVRPGGRTPLYCSAVGLAMLSALPSPEVDATLGDTPLATHTPHTLTDPAALRATLARAAQLGYAVDDEYHERDVRAVAAPVLDGDGRLVGAVGISGLTFTLDPESAELFGPMVRAAARTVSAGLGSTGPALGVVGSTAAQGGEHT
ncbi:IclR family transcriptional regulator [Streptomyces sp. NBC_00344]|uniref:IclR family transcriptional regulator n=1 Tax=Streptomyces sp. NBC_00344 TaxID=2975720 RepID=UPI002E1FA2D5